MQIAPRDLVGSADQPQVAVSNKGDVYVVFGAKDTIYCATSNDGGFSFGEPVVVATPGVLSLGARRGPRVAATEYGVVITAISGAKGGGKDGDLLAWWSKDGTNWSGPSKVSDSPGAAREGLHAMASSGNSVIAAWLDLRDDGTRVMSSKSTNGGRTWSKNTLVYKSPDGSVCECCNPSVAIGPYGEVAVMFRNDLRGDRDMYFAPSADGGKTFLPAAKIGNQTWTIDKCPMDGGSLTFDAGGTIMSIWRSRETLYLGRGSVATPIGPGRDAAIASGSHGFVIAWQTQGTGAIYAQYGTDVATRRRLAESGSSPVLARAPNGFIAAWRQTGYAPGIYVERLSAVPGS